MFQQVLRIDANRDRTLQKLRGRWGHGWVLGEQTNVRGLVGRGDTRRQDSTLVDPVQLVFSDQDPKVLDQGRHRRAKRRAHAPKADVSDLREGCCPNPNEERSPAVGADYVRDAKVSPQRLNSGDGPILDELSELDPRGGITVVVVPGDPPRADRIEHRKLEPTVAALPLFEHDSDKLVDRNA